jgi:hypothetical protein
MAFASSVMGRKLGGPRTVMMAPSCDPSERRGSRKNPAGVHDSHPLGSGMDSSTCAKREKYCPSGGHDLRCQLPSSEAAGGCGGSTIGAHGPHRGTLRSRRFAGEMACGGGPMPLGAQMSSSGCRGVNERPSETTPRTTRSTPATAISDPRMARNESADLASRRRRSHTRRSRRQAGVAARASPLRADRVREADLLWASATIESTTEAAPCLAARAATTKDDTARLSSQPDRLPSRCDPCCRRVARPFAARLAAAPTASSTRRRSDAAR